MSTGITRKRWNRGLKRKVEKGIISEEQAQAKFIRAQSSSSTKKAEEGIVSEEEAKPKRSRMEAIKEGLFSLVEAVKDEAITKKVVEDLFSLVETVKAEEGVKKENREKNCEAEETKNSEKASEPKHCVLKRQYKGEGKGGSLGVSVGPIGTVAADPANASCYMAERPAGENVIPPALKAYTKQGRQRHY